VEVDFSKTGAFHLGEGEDSFMLYSKPVDPGDFTDPFDA